jgi:hypothetical protein
MSKLIRFVVELASTWITPSGSGFLIWYAVLIFVGLINAYASVVNPTIIFGLGMAFVVTVPVAIGVFVVTPIWALVKSIRSLLRRSYPTAIAFGLVPFIGFAVLVLSSMLFTSMLTKTMIASYQSSIDAAVFSGSNVKKEGVEINLGPPIVARFALATMMWDISEIWYLEDDNTSRLDFPSCNRTIRPIGTHFYSVDGSC